MFKIILILIAIVSAGSFAWWTWKRRIKKSKSGKVGGLDEALTKGLITKEEFLRLHSDRANTKLKEFLKGKDKS